MILQMCVCSGECICVLASWWHPFLGPEIYVERRDSPEFPYAFSLFCIFLVSEATPSTVNMQRFQGAKYVPRPAASSNLGT